MAGKLLSAFKVFRSKKKKSPGVSPAQQPGELDHFQTMQDGEWLSWATGLRASEILPHPIPSHPIPSHPTHSGHSKGQEGRGGQADTQ